MAEEPARRQDVPSIPGREKRADQKIEGEEVNLSSS